MQGEEQLLQGNLYKYAGVITGFKPLTAKLTKNRGDGGIILVLTNKKGTERLNLKDATILEPKAVTTNVRDGDSKVTSPSS